MDDTPSPISLAHAERAQESMRALAHTCTGVPIPAPDARDLMGELALCLVRMADAFRGIGSGVRGSLTVFDVVEESGEHPGRAAVLAQESLQAAADAAAQAAQHVWDAQEALAGQGHRGRKDRNLPDEILF